MESARINPKILKGTIYLAEIRTRFTEMSTNNGIVTLGALVAVDGRSEEVFCVGATYVDHGQLDGCFRFELDLGVGVVVKVAGEKFTRHPYCNTENCEQFHRPENLHRSNKNKNHLFWNSTNKNTIYQITNTNVLN